MERDSAKAVRIVTIGSLNMDLVVRTDRLPRAGETLSGREFALICGGKGANQAVAAARAGADSLMVGRVGEDSFGKALVENLREERVDTTQVKATADCSSGIAVIHVSADGENAITVVSGANGKLAPGDIQGVESLIAGAAAVVLQLEIPLETVRAAVALARAHGVLTILDPAPVPADGLPDELYRVDVLSPNQTEAGLLTGIEVTGMEEAERAGGLLVGRGAGCAVLKLGGNGALMVSAKGIRKVPAFSVKAVDTTAAGDAFTAALAVALSEGMEAGRALRFACAAGAIAVTRFGAQPAMPHRAAIEELLEQTNNEER